jgi:thiamine phosphate synthase YjbQ (UPF0047 family)
MNLVAVDLKDLITPDKFELTSEDDLFDRLVSVVNNMLEDEAESGEEIYETSEAHVEINLNVDDDFSDDVTPDMVSALNKLYQSIGWREVTYEHTEETEDEYASHIFKFYFKRNSTPGVSL